MKLIFRHVETIFDFFLHETNVDRNLFRKRSVQQRSKMYQYYVFLRNISIYYLFFFDILRYLLLNDTLRKKIVTKAKNKIFWGLAYLNRLGRKCIRWTKRRKQYNSKEWHYKRQSNKCHKNWVRKQLWSTR